MFTQLLDTIKRYDRIIIHRHSRPDGDAMGSQIGLKHILMDSFPGKEVYQVGDDAGYLSFLPDSSMDQIADDMYRGALAIILDSGSPSLIADDRYTLAAMTARMDHHLFCGQIAQVEVIDSSYESCAGLVTAFAMECGLTVSTEAAAALFTGIVTDSGRFRYDSTSQRTFRAAAFLMEHGVDPAEIYRCLYASDLQKVQQKAAFAMRIQVTQHGAGWVYTTREELEHMGADPFAYSRGMVNGMADIRGVPVWVNFTESDKGVLCELRSDRMNINPIAVKYGGGGHAKASGATVADRETAMAMLADLDALAEQNA